MPRMGAREARMNFADVLNTAAYAKDRIVLTKNGKDVAAIIPIEDLRMLEEIENRIDVAEAEKVMARVKAGKERLIPWEEAKSSSWPAANRKAVRVAKKK
jgi:prevent-host-death family protein